MNKVFRFKNFYVQGWIALLITTFVFLYYITEITEIFKFMGIDLNKIGNVTGRGILALIPLILIYFIYESIKIILNKFCYLEIKDGFLNLVILSTPKWQVPISSITSIDLAQGQWSVKVDFVKVVSIVGTINPESFLLFGFSFRANDKIYRVKPRLKNFDEFLDTLLKFNPSIKLETLTLNEEGKFFDKPIF